MPVRRALLAGLIVVAACSSGGEFDLKEPRLPVHEGVVTAIGPQSMTFADGKKFRIADEVRSFTSSGHVTKALAFWKEKYVHIGTENSAVTYIAGIGIVAQIDPPIVLYTGELESVRGRRVTFADGTVLRLGPGVKSPKSGRVAVRLDPNRKIVTQITSQ